MNNTKRNTEISAKTFWSCALIATVVLILGLNAWMNKIDADRVAHQRVLSDICALKADVVKRPFVCIQWDAQRSTGRTTPPQG